MMMVQRNQHGNMNTNAARHGRVQIRNRERDGSVRWKEIFDLTTVSGGRAKASDAAEELIRTESGPIVV